MMSGLSRKAEGNIKLFGCQRDLPSRDTCDPGWNIDDSMSKTMTSSEPVIGNGSTRPGW